MTDKSVFMCFKERITKQFGVFFPESSTHLNVWVIAARPDCSFTRLLTGLKKPFQSVLLPFSLPVAVHNVVGFYLRTALVATGEQRYATDMMNRGTPVCTPGWGLPGSRTSGSVGRLVGGVG